MIDIFGKPERRAGPSQSMQEEYIKINMFIIKYLKITSIFNPPKILPFKHSALTLMLVYSTDKYGKVIYRGYQI